MHWFIILPRCEVPRREYGPICLRIHLATSVNSQTINKNQSNDSISSHKYPCHNTDVNIFDIKCYMGNDLFLSLPSHHSKSNQASLFSNVTSGLHLF